MGFQDRGFRGDSENQRKWKATCSDCGQECEVPFEPKPGKAVRCKDCFKKFKGY